MVTSTAEGLDTLSKNNILEISQIWGISSLALHPLLVQKKLRRKSQVEHRFLELSDVFLDQFSFPSEVRKIGISLYYYCTYFCFS